MTKTALVLIACALQCGCAQLKQQWYRDYAVGPLTLDDDSAYLRLVKVVTTPIPPARTALIEVKCFGPVEPAEARQCRVSRNITVSALMMTSEELCIAHRKTMYGNDAAANIAFGTFTGLFAGAAAVVGHEATQSLLAALAAFSNAERSLVNETVYKTILVPAVDRKIGEIRATKAASINASLQGDLDAYPVTVALNEVVAFHYSCSFMTGLERALAEGTQGTTAQRILKLRETLRSIVARRQVLRCVDADASSAPAASAPDASAQSSEECATLKMRLDAAADALSKAETEQ